MDWERTAVRYEHRHRSSLTRHGGRAWGLWRAPERELGLLGDVRDRDVLELGCGAAWWSVALAQDGARAVGLDFSPRRLEQARERLRAGGVTFPLVRARAESLPFAPSSFDLILSDYGATTFADPYRTIPEAARVLREGGRMVFAHPHPLRTLALDPRAGRMRRRLRSPYFGMHEVHYGSSREFQLPFGEWIRLFASAGLVVDRLIELPAPARGSTYVSRADLLWARRWPMEAIWSVRKEIPLGSAGMGRADPVSDGKGRIRRGRPHAGRGATAR